MRKVLYACLVSLVCSLGCTDYDQGLRAGRNAARQARGAGGELAGHANNLVLQLMPGKVDSSKSNEWNAGFRDGYDKEVNK